MSSSQKVQISMSSDRKFTKDQPNDVKIQLMGEPVTRSLEKTPGQHPQRFCVLSKNNYAVIEGYSRFGFGNLKLYRTNPNRIEIIAEKAYAMTLLDKDHLIFTEWDGLIKKLNLKTNEVTTIGKIQYATLSFVKLLPNNLLALGTTWGKLYLWDLSKEQNQILFTKDITKDEYFKDEKFKAKYLASSEQYQNYMMDEVQHDYEIHNLALTEDKKYLVILTSKKECNCTLHTLNLEAMEWRTVQTVLESSGKRTPYPYGLHAWESMIALPGNKIAIGTEVIDLMTGVITFMGPSGCSALAVLPDNTLIMNGYGLVSYEGSPQGNIWFYHLDSKEKIAAVQIDKRYQFEKIIYNKEDGHLICVTSVNSPDDTAYVLDCNLGIAEYLAHKRKFIKDVVKEFGIFQPASIIADALGWIEIEKTADAPEIKITSP